MPVFVPSQTIETREPRVVVDAGLRPGSHRFRLVVVNERGVESLPDEAIVTIVQLDRPVPGPRVTVPPRPPVSPPVLDPIRPGGRATPPRPGGGGDEE